MSQTPKAPGEAEPPTVLCIEDDRETAGLLAEDLTERGYRVLVRHNGREGLSAIMAQRPDLVLCDLNMPIMSGFEVLERLTANAPWLSDMPFVFLTALTDRDSELRGRRLGADDYVTKPIDFDILATIVKARLSRVPRRDLWRRDVALSPREIDALTWSARGKTSDEIAQILDLTRRTVDFHLDNARTKLGVATRTQAVAVAIAAELIML
ncbi:response regulator transcription factor [Phenylobacterium montanum]|uniref:Response regulator n=1 Tax=Phenylobacterium montanum TaxID=2823693 RepID=A0A975FVY8_9CAUL|nr:response regulator [Caulobacter sp. S6]QUD85974.1 response regulator [Caulobacter sp. S6]